MLLNGWAIALTICSFSILLLAFAAGWCGVRVVRFWDHGADTALQIKLEAQVWLTSALMKYALLFQAISLVMLVLAADAFSGMLVGAMCATGAFMANEYGIVTLLFKIMLVFLSGYWLLMNHFDNRSESYPLVKLKYIHLFFLLPLLVADALLQLLYLVNLEPDILTSCCGVLLKPSTGDGFNLLDPFSPMLLLGTLYIVATIVVVSGGMKLYAAKKQQSGSVAINFVYAGGWFLFFPIALWAVTVFFSSYIYAMPYHRCPFDILQREYSYIGYPIYLTLFFGTFFGVTSGLVQPLKKLAGLGAPVEEYSSRAIAVSIFLMLLFLMITAYAPVSYVLTGGEVG